MSYMISGEPPAEFSDNSIDSTHCLNENFTQYDTDGFPLQFRYYDIVHWTNYRYEYPVEQSTHTLRLHPVNDHMQVVERSALKLSVDGERLQFEDTFGNTCSHLTVSTPYLELRIEVEHRIKVYQRADECHDHPLRKPHIPMIWMPWQRQMLLPFLLPPELPESELHELRDYAISFVKRNNGQLQETLHDINQTLYNEYTYLPGVTEVGTSPFEIYAKKVGVCQDFTNLFICLARLLNIPARYRVGYIYVHCDHRNHRQAEASHAWAEVYLPYLGWRGYDPTNGSLVGYEHVRLACGRNYRDATPTSGTIFRGGAGETMEVGVKTIEIPSSM